MAPDKRRAGVVPPERARRLFFALWPDEAMRRAMIEATRDVVQARRGSDPACGGRPVPAASLHVTLAFLGAVPQRRLQALAQVAQTVAETLRSTRAGEDAPGCPLELTFDHLEHWPAARLLCALPAAPPARTVALARSLQARLTASGFAPDLKPFRPHVTVVRKVSCPSPLTKMSPVAW
ncbi:MAG: RNA 2',3'-cyclic phosphodiesterase, partial [Steroidobacteraceae bacterium]